MSLTPSLSGQSVPWASRGTSTRASDAGLTITFLQLRRAIGFAGISFPFVLWIGNAIMVRGFGLQGSMSAYYYTGMRNVFVAFLCTIAVFLISYRGYNLWDNWLTGIAGVAAIIVALFPTTPATNATAHQKTVGTIHLTAAATFFVAIGIVCIWLFTQTSGVMTHQKRTRNTVYRTCGIVIFVSLVAVTSANLFASDFSQRNHVLYWCEATAVVAFGTAWLIKGEFFLRDQA